MTDFYDAIRELISSTVKVSIDSADLSTPPAASDFPYAVLGGTQPTELSGPDRFRATLANKPTKVVLDVQITYAALNRTALGIVMRNVRTALKSGPPAVQGYRCHMSRPVSLQPVEVDRDISWGGLNPLYAIDELRLTAHMTGDLHATQ